MIRPERRVLVYGYGNPGRQDDGLGVQMVSMLERDGLSNVAFECNYQLNVEDALEVANHDMVIFVDATVEGDRPFSFCHLSPAHEVSFTTHAMKPESVLALCIELYNRSPLAFVLAIRGYQWELFEGLTPEAERNLEKAHDFLKYFLSENKRDAARECV